MFLVSYTTDPFFETAMNVDVVYTLESADVVKSQVYLDYQNSSHDALWASLVIQILEQHKN